MLKNSRIVLDTNVIVSALISKPESGLSRLLEHLVRNSTFVICNQTYDEFERVLLGPKLAKYIDVDRVIQFLTLYWIIAELIVVTNIEPYCRDPKDDVFLALALEADADLVITGDSDLLVLNPFKGVQILSPSTLNY